MSPPLRILWVKSGPLFPLNTGGRKRTHAMLRELNREHEVTYIAFATTGKEVSQEEEAADYATIKQWLPFHEPRQTSPVFFLSLLQNFVFSPLPYALQKWVNAAMTQAIEEECQQRKYDLIICDFLYPAPNVVIARSGVPTILFQHNMESQIWERMAANKTNPVTRAYFQLQFQRMFNAEQRLSKSFSGVITVSPDDTRFARDRYQLKNVLGDVPTGVDTEFFAPSETEGSPHCLGFLGSMDWMPNIEAVEWFVEKILPLIHRRNPKIEFKVIGRNPPPSIRRLADADHRITVTGTVNDVRPPISDCRALVVPLLSGGGTRIKILEAMSMGIPVVSTFVGAEGLNLTSGENILLAESKEEIADACLKLINDNALRDSLAKHGRRRVLTEHTWRNATNVFIGHCRKVLNANSESRS